MEQKILNITIRYNTPEINGLEHNIKIKVERTDISEELLIEKYDREINRELRKLNDTVMNWYVYSFWPESN